MHYNISFNHTETLKLSFKTRITRGVPDKLPMLSMYLLIENEDRLELVLSTYVKHRLVDADALQELMMFF